MEKKIYQTKITGKFVTNNYVLGRISGIMAAICSDDLMTRRGYASYSIIEINEETKEETIVSHTIRVETTAERYERFKEIVEAQYPECKFETEILDR